jgi:RNAse (barnase) inhibitor barstar
MIVRIDAAKITDADSFHSEFATAFGFPAYYGRNLDAWVDCLTCLDDPTAGMTKVNVLPGQILTLVLENADGFKGRCPDLFTAFLECSAFVNWRRVEVGQAPVLALAADG